MRRVLGLLALVVGLAVVGAPVDSTLDAQDKTKTKLKDKDKKDAKEADAGGTVEVYKAKDGYRFRIKNTEGKSIAISTRGHESKDDAIKDLDTVKSILTKSKPKIED